MHFLFCVYYDLPVAIMQGVDRLGLHPDGRIISLSNSEDVIRVWDMSTFISTAIARDSNEGKQLMAMLNSDDGFTGSDIISEPYTGNSVMMTRQTDGHVVCGSASGVVHFMKKIR